MAGRIGLSTGTEGFGNPAGRFQSNPSSAWGARGDGTASRAPAQPAVELRAPCNALEAEEDAQGRWRGYVNDCLTHDYPALWALLDSLLYLDVPDMAAVLRWRSAQEAALPADRQMPPAALARFVAHYERLTGWMQRTMPEVAELVGLLDENHRLTGLRAADPGA